MARVGQYRNVAVPIDEYVLLREIADKENRSIARQVAQMIQQRHFDLFPQDYEAVHLAQQFMKSGTRG
jgi:hypothetical protein